MRLAVIENGEWMGGIVLGSPFPNLRPRDDAFGLTKYVRDWKDRGLDNPWVRENHLYWSKLQLVVNQARAFVFPDLRGSRIGIRSHALLETEGRAMWEATYGRLAGFDTLARNQSHGSSRTTDGTSWVAHSATPETRESPCQERHTKD